MVMIIFFMPLPLGDIMDHRLAITSLKALTKTLVFLGKPHGHTDIVVKAVRAQWPDNDALMQQGLINGLGIPARSIIKKLVWVG